MRFGEYPNKAAAVMAIGAFTLSTIVTSDAAASGSSETAVSAAQLNTACEAYLANDLGGKIDPRDVRTMSRSSGKMCFVVATVASERAGWKPGENPRYRFCMDAEYYSFGDKVRDMAKAYVRLYRGGQISGSAGLASFEAAMIATWPCSS